MLCLKEFGVQKFTSTRSGSDLVLLNKANTVLGFNLEYKWIKTEIMLGVIQYEWILYLPASLYTPERTSKAILRLYLALT